MSIWSAVIIGFCLLRGVLAFDQGARTLGTVLANTPLARLEPPRQGIELTINPFLECTPEELEFIRTALKERRSAEHAAEVEHV
jgi:hypothetical protein